MIKNVEIFDCTLREVGYQTGWNFSNEFVQSIYKFALGKGIDYVELGFFHNEEADPGRGDFRYCSIRNEEIYNLFKDMKKTTKLTAMRDIQRPLSNLVYKKNSIIDIVRIMSRSHENNFDILGAEIEQTQQLGYEVFANFTSAGYNTIEKNIKFAEFIKSKGVNSVEFADTESIMTADYVKNTIKICHDAGLKVGIHFHDKNGTAEMLANTALENGADYIDVTHLGLGGKCRDGNLTMEYLLRKMEVNPGYEATIVKNKLIEDLIKYNDYSVAE